MKRQKPTLTPVPHMPTCSCLTTFFIVIYRFIDILFYELQIKDKHTCTVSNKKILVPGNKGDKL